MTPKHDHFTMPGEWHRHKACWMAWPRHQATWANLGLSKARMAYAKVALAIANYEPVCMLVHPDDLNEAKMLCGPNIRLVALPIDDSWVRDTGPTFLISQHGELAGVDWIHNAWGGNYQEHALDDKIAAAIIEDTGAHYFKAPLVMEGGSFHVDGEGTILTTRECLLNANRNPTLSQQDIEKHLCDYLGHEQVIWLNHGLCGDETDGHVDEIACFVAPGEVLALVTEDKNDENYDRLQDNLDLLQTTKDAKGRRLKVHTVEQPPATYLAEKRLTLSYINFYLANQGLVMPAFGYPSFDHKAKECLAACFPTYGITQIQALDIFAGGGGIHCITQQQPLPLLRR